jgi:hypothetical protein
LGKQQDYREDARKWVALCEQRYQGSASTFFPLLIARRWLSALEREPIDIDEIAAIVREAEARQNNFDIAFHAFCNDLRSMYQALWQERLSQAP